MFYCLMIEPSRPSQRAANVAYYWRNRDVEIARVRLRQDGSAMDFDHRDPSTKSAPVTGMIGRAGDARILAELAKCDIVCGNCHRLRTYDRREGRRIERE